MVGRGLGGKNCFKFVSSCFKFVGEQEVTEEAQEEFSQKGTKGTKATAIEQDATE